MNSSSVNRCLACLAAGAIILTASSGPAFAESKQDTIKIDGSSTVYPITEAMAEEFGKLPGADATKITVGISGTGGGFKKFCAGETDISGASRPIKPTEIEACKASKIEYVELPVAYDALSVVVNLKNTWAQSLTVAELKKMWEPDAQGKITNWSQIRAGFPDKPLKLFGAGVDSGTYDYFTEAVVGKEHSSRGDFTSSEDDNVLVQGVSGDTGALGFFGMSYYEENMDKLRAVPVDDEVAENGAGPQMPTAENVVKGLYRPLARPLFIYVRKDALQREQVQKFVKFYMQSAPATVAEVGYVKVPEEVYTLANKRLEQQKAGTVFAAGQSPALTLAERMKQDS